jgi:DNA primase small subunit
MDIIDPDEDSYKDMLEKCKQPLQNLLDILQNDFDFSDITVAFSGGRGYHVHVRDDTVQQLGRQERSEIVNYVYARGLDLEIGNQPNHISNPSLVYRTRNGWYKKVYAAMCDLISKIEKETEVETKKEILKEYGLTEKEAKASLQDIESNKSRIRAGNLTTTNDSNLQTVIDTLAESIIETHRAEVDEPVTTDINRLIRLPSSLHGGTGLKVTELTPDEVDEFEPLTDAIPEKFKEFEIQVKVLEDVTVELNGEQNKYTEGITTVPEFIGIYLMADGVAEKTSE